MQINGIGNNQIGNSYQNSNRMPNSTTGKKEEDDVSKRLEALGVKVELSFQQTEAHPREQEVIKESDEAENAQQGFPVLEWIKKIWEAGIAWLKSIWKDEAGQERLQADEPLTEAEMLSEDVTSEKLFEANPELVAEMPLAEDTDYVNFPTDKYRQTGTPLHTSGMQDSYNRYGQHSKLGVETSNNIQERK